MLVSGHPEMSAFSLINKRELWGSLPLSLLPKSQFFKIKIATFFIQSCSFQVKYDELFYMDKGHLISIFSYDQHFHSDPPSPLF